MSKANKINLSEDWIATIIGLLVIVIAVTAFVSVGWAATPVKYAWNGLSELGNVFANQNLAGIITFGIISYVAVAVIFLLQGKNIKNTIGFLPLFAIAVAALTIGGNSAVNNLGLEAVIFSLIIGLLINNIWGTPAWIRKALASELYVKIGLILLGTTIFFQDLLKSGALGLIQAVIVVFTVWNFAFWLFRRLKIDKELALMMSSGVSICGVAAAIASAGVIKGDSKKLSFVVSLVLVIAVPMIVLMPFLAHLIGLNDTLAGAWIGGTIDTTGAVVATGTIYGDEAVKIATIVKFSQNVLLGVAAFAIAIYWAATSQNQTGLDGQKPSAHLLWDRFPKFVIGFVLASLVFSLFFAGEGYAPLSKSLKALQTLFFTLGFVSIGLETDFRALINKENKKATLAFVGAQTFNVLFTLAVALAIFGIHWS